MFHPWVEFIREVFFNNIRGWKLLLFSLIKPRRVTVVVGNVFKSNRRLLST